MLKELADLKVQAFRQPAFVFFFFELQPQVEAPVSGVSFVVRPRACFLARSFSGSEKRRVRKPKNHLLCKWIRMLQLTEKPPML